MRITKVELKNFKRFTDLTIDGIPADTRLVLLIGSNGSGKSSVFDAFEYLNTASKFPMHSMEGPQYKGAVMSLMSSLAYLKKIKQDPISIELIEQNDKSYRIGTNQLYPNDTLSETAFYGRSSYRQIPRLNRSLQERRASDMEISSGNDADRPRSFTDYDKRFITDIDRISKQIFEDIFRSGASAVEIRKKYIDPINQAFVRVFAHQKVNTLSLVEIIPPAENKATQVNFRKGESAIEYDYLSAGEKEVFNILFNLLMRKDRYADTVYFFDELDLHLNTQLQFNLLKEIIENWLPENCQLWTASHSLGFIDYARKYPQGVVIDFDDLDFDQPQTLFPQPNDQLDVYDIAVPKEMLFEIMRDKKLVLCENQNDESYNLLALPDTLFVGMKDARSIFLQVRNEGRFYSLRDRDFLSDMEIKRLRKKYPNHHILRYYDFENYLYHPDNIAELQPAGFERATYIADIVRQKNERFDATLLNLKSTRQSYEELKTADIADKEPDAIVADLKSDDFERFYKFFDMKDGFSKLYLMPFNLDKKRLIQTRWFRAQIEAVLAH